MDENQKNSLKENVLHAYKGSSLGTCNSLSYTVAWHAAGGQDGAIFGDFLFKFGNRGNCTVFSVSEQKEFGKFTLDKSSLICPHSNSVCFGAQRYHESDEFPLLYSNIYNNYANEENKHEGECCVYRVIRNGNNFTTELVQIIKIGFTEKKGLWRSMNINDIRPYGNFAVDTATNTLIAFTMLDETMVTRYFTFELPKLSDGIYSDIYGCNVICLSESMIKTSFDSDYSYYLQGACCKDGLLYSVEGLTDSARNLPRMQVIDVANKKQFAVMELSKMGLIFETEFIDFYGDTLYYIDSKGWVCRITFH